MRGPRAAAWEARLPTFLHRHQLPQGHGMGNCSARDRPAMRTCSASTGTATWCGLPGTSLAEGTFLLCERLWITDAKWDPNSQTFQGRNCRCGCLCTYV